MNLTFLSANQNKETTLTFKTLFLILFSALKMSRTVAFGRDILGAPDVDIEVKKLLLNK